MLRTAFVLVALALALASCRALLTPPPRIEVRCREACENAAHHCSKEDCARGCAFILDRLAEGEREPILACVAKNTKSCNDPVWADCAVTIGVHADGGPPAPPSPEE
jgi:hypothetical protein